MNQTLFWETFCGYDEVNNEVMDVRISVWITPYPYD